MRFTENGERRPLTLVRSVEGGYANECDPGADVPDVDCAQMNGAFTLGRLLAFKEDL